MGTTHLQYDKMIMKIAVRLSEGDKFLEEELRCAMHFALPAVIGEMADDLMAKVLTEVAEAYLRGYKGDTLCNVIDNLTDDVEVIQTPREPEVKTCFPD